MLQSWIDRAVSYCVHHFRTVILIALLLTAASAVYTARHFAIDTNVNNLLSAKLPWRQQEIAFHENFPQTLDIILIDVSAATPEPRPWRRGTSSRRSTTSPTCFTR
jgi:predicted RND superfamily exporter protein